MSHELRTPLNAVIGYSELLQDEASDRGLVEFERDLGRIRGAGQHLLALVSDVLDLARIEADRIQLTPTTFVVHELVREVIDAIQGLAGRNGNSLHAIEAPGLSVMKADMLRVKQILLNLLGNACKFTKDGDISLDVSPRDEGGNAWIVFAVRDSGVGIAPADLPKLFTEFPQIESPQNHREGAGLGLAISQRLAVAMGGRITVKSALGKGTTFTVEIPAAPLRTHVGAAPEVATTVSPGGSAPPA
jgi:signal transduction histidine kinase